MLRRECRAICSRWIVGRRRQALRKCHHIFTLRRNPPRQGFRRRIIFVRRVPWWGVVSSLAAPLLLMGGWTLAAAVQPVPFDSVVLTISDLAALDTPHRWLMTSALIGVGLAHLTTAWALGCAATAGRVVLGLGGAATLLVAAFPLPSDGSSSSAHTATAAIAFLSLALWPWFAWNRPRVPRRTAPLLLGPAVSAAATVTLLMALALFVAEQFVSGQRVGLAERVAAGAQALWPLAVVLSARLSRPNLARDGAASDRPNLGTVPLDPGQT